MGHKPLTKNERIALRKQDPGYRDQHIRKIEKFSDRFNSIFLFFLRSHRKGILTFAGVEVTVLFEENGPSSREAFRRFDDGMYRGKDITSRHNNIVRTVIQAKKAWGLWVDQWSLGIAEGTFTKYEILEQFADNGITIPDSLMKDFENRIWKRRFEYTEKHS